jgi:tRNA-splicing ligase RtcB
MRALGGIEADLSWGSTCHGAGRVMSREAAIRQYSVGDVKKQMESKGIYLKGATEDGIQEEVPQAYKHIDEVIKVVTGAGLSKPVAKLTPIGVMKG